MVIKCKFLLITLPFNQMELNQKNPWRPSNKEIRYILSLQRRKTDASGWIKTGTTFQQGYNYTKRQLRTDGCLSILWKRKWLRDLKQKKKKKITKTKWWQRLAKATKQCKKACKSLMKALFKVVRKQD